MSGQSARRRRPTGRLLSSPERPAAAGEIDSRLQWHDLPPDAPADVFPLTKLQIREIERRVKDLDDPRRYVIKSTSCPGSTLNFFYDVAEDVWSIGIEGATYFKRRASAVAIKRTLDAKTKVLEVRRPDRSASPKAGRSSRSTRR